jgi:C_GCAxxG_C_C family probable redox protein
MSVRSEFAVSCFSGGFNCSQSVLLSHCEELGLEKETALKLACGFGGGMALTGEACGAVTGALMLIGLAYGKFRPEDNAAKEKTYALAREFSERFRSMNGSINCTELVGYDLGDAAAHAAARDAGVFKTVCPRLVKESVELVERMLQLAE